MKSRRIPTLLTAAAACCGVAEPASVRGGAGGGGRRNDADAIDDRTRPLHEQQRQDQHQRERQRQKNGRARRGRSLQAGENGDHWWHENRSEEKDIVYFHPISPSDNGDQLQVMSASSLAGPPKNGVDEGTAYAPQGTMQANSAGGGGGGGDGGDDGGRGGFQVFSIAVSNDPDTSNLPHNLPRPTSDPTSSADPTSSPRPTPEPSPSTASPSPTEESSAVETADVKHYPLWTKEFQGCSSSSDPPSVYVDAMENGHMGMQYLFDAKYDCCEAFFKEKLDRCVESEFEETENGNVVVTEGGGDDMDVSTPWPTSGPPQVTVDWLATAEPTPSPNQPTLLPTPYPTTSLPTSGPSPRPVLTNYHALSLDGPRTTSVLFEDSFESGSIHYSDREDDYFAWSRRGNGWWRVADVEYWESFDGEYKVATTGGSGKFAMESNLILTVGGRRDDTTAFSRGVIQRGGAYITFGVRTSVEFPMDSLVFRLNDKILGYWTSPTDDWEEVAAYLPRHDADRDGYVDNDAQEVHELKWTYGYYGSKDADFDRGDVVQLDTVLVRATTGDFVIDDDEYENIQHGVVPALNLHHPSADLGWEVVSDDDAYEGSYVLSADTRQIIRAANSDSISTYHGTATMTLTIITGEFGGKLDFAIYPNVHAPIDVLEVGVDGEAVMASTGSSSEWEAHSIELDPGRRVLTFTHISNPAELKMSDLEGMGQPGSSKVDGLRYTDHIDPRFLTPVPTASPTEEPTLAPTPFSIPPQNYCGNSLSSIQDKCYTDDAITCNNDDDPCPAGTFCWGNVECDVPLWFIEMLRATPSPTESPTRAPSPSAIPPQNYCGTSLKSIKETCSSGNLYTCNDGDDPCPQGTYCWGNVKCKVPREEEAALAPQNYCGTSLASIKATCARGTLPTCNDGDDPCASGTYCWGNVECDPIEDSPTAHPTERKESFLDSFFGTNSGDDGASESRDEAPSQQENDRSCPDGTSPVQGLLNCCVPDQSFLGDGACDAYTPYNTAECGYDLGDCCRESCNVESSTFKCAAKEGDAYGPFGFYCLDPRYGNIDEDACGADNREWVGDGGCDPDYNTQECGWDGGDCCRDTCDPTYAYYECGRDAQPYDCKDPDVIYRAGYVP